MNGLKDAVVLITGGGSGLGRALVERFLREGARVAVMDSRAERVEQLVADLGDQVEAIAGDVTQYSDNERAVQRAVSRFGRLDTFIANAGVFDFFQALPEYEGDKLGTAFDELFSVNVKGGLLGARAALPELIKTRGSILFTISNAGFYPGGGGPLYTASKHALVGLVKQLAHELAPKVRVNGVAPGGMKTNLSGLHATGTGAQSMADVEGLDQMLRDVTPLQIAPRPEDYCGPYVLLASAAEAGPITGVIINTDGGLGVRGIINIRGGEAL